MRRPPRLGGLILENRGREADGEEHVEHIKEEDLLLNWSCPLSCIINKLSVPTLFFRTHVSGEVAKKDRTGTCAAICR